MKISCKTCGANLSFMPSKQIAYCDHCGNTYEVENLDFDDSTYEDCEEYTCSSCGAKILSFNKTTLANCVYCGGKEFVKAPGNKEYILSGIIPFKIDKDEFRKEYLRCLNDIKCDKKFIEAMKDAQITGVYLPYSFANSFYRKEHSKIVFDLLEEIIPFSFDELKDMNPIYLDGFYAENIKTKVEDNYIKTKDTSFFWVPVWIAETTYKNEKYYVVMNGQSKELAGNYEKISKNELIYKYKRENFKKLRRRNDIIFHLYVFALSMLMLQIVCMLVYFPIVDLIFICFLFFLLKKFGVIRHKGLLEKS